MHQKNRVSAVLVTQLVQHASMTNHQTELEMLQAVNAKRFPTVRSLNASEWFKPAIGRRCPTAAATKTRAFVLSHP